LFRSEVYFSLYSWLPSYWSSLNAYFGSRSGFSSVVIAGSNENTTQTLAQSQSLTHSDDEKIQLIKRTTSRDADSSIEHSKSVKKAKNDPFCSVLQGGFEMIGQVLSVKSTPDDRMEEVLKLLKQQNEEREQETANLTSVLSLLGQEIQKLAEK
jgi:hypothetical protein